MNVLMTDGGLLIRKKARGRGREERFHCFLFWQLKYGCESAGVALRVGVKGEGPSLLDLVGKGKSL